VKADFIVYVSPRLRGAREETVWRRFDARVLKDPRSNISRYCAAVRFEPIAGRAFVKSKAKGPSGSDGRKDLVDLPDVLNGVHGVAAVALISTMRPGSSKAVHLTAISWQRLSSSTIPPFTMASLVAFSMFPTSRRLLSVGGQTFIRMRYGPISWPWSRAAIATTQAASPIHALYSGVLTILPRPIGFQSLFADGG
jgi:hypothetical protein